MVKNDALLEIDSVKISIVIENQKHTVSVCGPVTLE